MSAAEARAWSQSLRAEAAVLRSAAAAAAAEAKERVADSRNLRYVIVLQRALRARQRAQR